MWWHWHVCLSNTSQQQYSHFVVCKIYNNNSVLSRKSLCWNNGISDIQWIVCVFLNIFIALSFLCIEFTFVVMVIHIHLIYIWLPKRPRSRLTNNGLYLFFITNTSQSPPFILLCQCIILKPLQYVIFSRFTERPMKVLSTGTCESSL